MIKSNFSQKGISLFLAIIILSIILAIVLGLTAILIGQIKTIREIGHSVVALYAADTGVERALYERFRADNLISFFGDSNIGNDSSYKVWIYCCDKGGEAGADCMFDENDPDPEKHCPLVPDPENNPDPVKSDCKATQYCVRSIGTYENTKRAIEVKIFPISIAP